MGPDIVRETLQFLLHHGYSVVFVWVFVEQIGLPIPSLPMLMAAGALAGSHQLSFWRSLGLTLTAGLTSDLIWYHLGQLRGHRILGFLCRISLEPDSCVRRTENLFTRRGYGSLLVAKFVPGLGAVTAPLAGMIRMPLWRFLAWDAGGISLWAGSALVAGYAFSRELERAGVYALRMGSGLAVLILGGLAAYLGRKVQQRRRFLGNLHMARITATELKQKLDLGESVDIIDLRHSIELEDDGARIPGAIHIDPEQLEARRDEVPRDRDIVLYCT